MISLCLYLWYQFIRDSLRLCFWFRFLRSQLFIVWTSAPILRNDSIFLCIFLEPNLNFNQRNPKSDHYQFYFLFNRIYGRHFVPSSNLPEKKNTLFSALAWFVEPLLNARYLNRRMLTLWFDMILRCVPFHGNIFINFYLPSKKRAHFQLNSGAFSYYYLSVGFILHRLCSIHTYNKFHCCSHFSCWARLGGKRSNERAMVCFFVTEKIFVLAAMHIIHVTSLPLIEWNVSRCSSYSVLFIFSRILLVLRSWRFIHFGSTLPLSLVISANFFTSLLPSLDFYLNWILFCNSKPMKDDLPNDNDINDIPCQKPQEKKRMFF